MTEHRTTTPTLEAVATVLDTTLNMLEKAKRMMLAESESMPAALHARVIAARNSIGELSAIAQGREDASSTFRQGALCRIGRHEYFHTGDAYLLATTPDGDSVFDLRDLPGFAETDIRHRARLETFHCPEIHSIAARDQAVADAAVLISNCLENVWWESVTTFLFAHHAHMEERERALGILVDFGNLSPEAADRMLA